jgi:hypothetical protein
MFFNYAVPQHSKNVGEKKLKNNQDFPGYWLMSAAYCKPWPSIKCFLDSNLAGAHEIAFSIRLNIVTAKCARHLRKVNCISTLLNAFIETCRCSKHLFTVQQRTKAREFILIKFTFLKRLTYMKMRFKNKFNVLITSSDTKSYYKNFNCFTTYIFSAVI